MKITRYLLLAMGIMITGFPVSAQEDAGAPAFKNGLVLKRPAGRRMRSLADPIEKAMVLGTWKSPLAGDKVVMGDTTIAWQEISVDDDGWINDRSIRGGYVYFNINSDQDQVMLMDCNGNDLAYVNSHLRVGNRYGYKKTWEPWEPNFNFTLLPVQLKKGKNEFLFRNTRSGRLNVSLTQPSSDVLFNIKDPTLPDLIIGEKPDTWGAVIVLNAGNLPLKGYEIEARLGDNPPVKSELPIIQALTVRKVGFKILGSAPGEKGDMNLALRLVDNNGKEYDRATISLQVKSSSETHKCTFISEIDGSIQYYAINPAQEKPEDPKALVLSVHGAAVEAINQAGSYNGKTWAHIVSPTNRRPYGFNWEDWGRLDALEVLEIANNKLNIDPSRVYLTGHSMGGHGSWHLGGTFPDKFAAIGPSAGWLSFRSYRMRNDEAEQSEMEKMLRRPTTPSHTMAISENYKQHGVYIIHGADDNNVRADQSRRMVENLEKFHKDFIYHEEPGQGHWWDLSDEPGADCVDWPPLFDFFARHARPEKKRIRNVEFITASPGVSAQNNWLTIEAQERQLDFSKVNIRLDPGKKRFVGTTENVARMSFDLSVMDKKDSVFFMLDDQQVVSTGHANTQDKIWIEKKAGQWQISENQSPDMKGPHRYGTFKDAFRNKFMFVYGTNGNKQENDWALAKAKYDAEYFWYQGNGSIDIVADTDFDQRSEPDRNVILYGNAKTNRAWKTLLKDSPVQVLKGKVKIGKKTIKGKDLGCLFVRPRPGSDIASVAAVAGTGITGMKLTNRRPYLSPAYGYPDLIVFNPELISDREKGVKVAGFFGLDWGLDSGEFVWGSGK